MGAAVASHSDDQMGRLVVRLMIAAAVVALSLWILSSAFGWRGYPAEPDGGRVVAAILGVLCLVILLTISLTAIAPLAPSRRLMFIAIGCWSVARLVTTCLFPLGSDEA